VHKINVNEKGIFNPIADYLSDEEIKNNIQESIKKGDVRVRSLIEKQYRRHGRNTRMHHLINMPLNPKFFLDPDLVIQGPQPGLNLAKLHPGVVFPGQYQGYNYGDGVFRPLPPYLGMNPKYMSSTQLNQVMAYAAQAVFYNKPLCLEMNPELTHDLYKKFNSYILEAKREIESRNQCFRGYFTYDVYNFNDFTAYKTLEEI
jgi:hypothetical protein